MTPDEIEIEVAKADGWEMWEGADGKNVSLAKPRDDYQRDYWLSLGCKPTTREPTTFGTLFLPKYTTSHDAIVPVIEKVCKDNDSLFISFIRHLADIVCGNQEWYDFPKDFRLVFFATPEQLCIAFVKALGRFKE